VPNLAFGRALALFGRRVGGVAQAHDQPQTNLEEAVSHFINTTSVVRSTRLFAAIAAAAISLVLALSAGSAMAQPAMHQCQHPVTTGEEAYNLHGIDAATACGVVRDLSHWLTNASNQWHLYRCQMADNGWNGRPILKIHRYDGYRLSIVKTYYLEMSRGRSSFAVTGDGFPLNCN
jgi:hypothetical protein